MYIIFNEFGEQCVFWELPIAVLANWQVPRGQEVIGLLTNKVTTKEWLINIYMYMYMTDT